MSEILHIILQITLEENFSILLVIQVQITCS